jgi:hypothetical protein
MKKTTIKKFVVALCLLITTQTIFSQKYEGMKSVGINLSKTDFGWMTKAVYSQYLTDYWQLKPSIGFEYSTKFDMKHYCIYANTEFMRDIMQSVDNHVFLIGGGASFQYENVDVNGEMGPSFVRKQVNVGLLGSASYEYYVSRKIMLGADLTFNYNPLTKYAPTKFWGGVSLNYIIY